MGTRKDTIVTLLIYNLPVLEIHRREQWFDLNKDRKWRMFERVVITDRQAAHKEKSSMSSKWNKMPLNVLLQPLPPSPINFWLGAQVAITEELELPSIPSIRREPGKSLVTGQIKIVYVSRQESTRKFNVSTHDGIVRVLDGLQANGVAADGKNVRVKVEVARFETMSAKQQIQMAYDADVSPSPFSSRLVLTHACSDLPRHSWQRPQ